MADMDAVVTRLQGLGLTESKAKETVKNKSLTSNLTQLMDLAGEGLEKAHRFVQEQLDDGTDNSQEKYDLSEFSWANNNMFPQHILMPHT